MPHSTRSSSASVPCRLEWRPSRWLIAVLLVLAVAAAFSVLASEMPRIAAWPLALAALAWGSWRARSEARRASESIVIQPAGVPSTVNNVAVEAMQVRWRGPIALLQWRDGTGRLQRRSAWPDVLPALQRRELRLAAPAPVNARAPASMAP